MISQLFSTKTYVVALADWIRMSFAQYMFYGEMRKKTKKNTLSCASEILLPCDVPKRF